MKILFVFLDVTTYMSLLHVDQIGNGINDVSNKQWSKVTRTNIQAVLNYNKKVMAIGRLYQSQMFTWLMTLKCS